MLFRSSTTIFTLSLLNLILGLCVQIGLAATLGTSREMDAVFVAISLPTFLTAVSMSACMSALVPFFKKQLDTGDPGRMARISKKLFAFFFVISLVVSSAAFLLAEPFVRIAAPGLDPSTSRITAGLLRILILGSFFDIQRGFLTAYYASQEIFFLPQFVPIINQVFLLFGLLLLVRSPGLYGWAWTWTGGSAIMFLLLMIRFLRREGHRFSRSVLSTPLENVWALFLPAFIVILLQQMSPLLDRLAASLLPTGAISYLGYAGKIPDVFLRTLPMAIILASFPRQSRQAAEKDYAALFDLAIQKVRWILIFSVPLALLVLMIRQPLVVVLFQRGNFDAASTAAVSNFLGWYAFAFIPAGMLYLLVNLGFAVQSPWSIARLTFLGLGLTLVLNLSLSRIWGPSGIAVSYLITACLLVAAYLLWFKIKMRLPLLIPGAGWIGKTVLAAMMGLAAMAGIGYLLPLPEPDFLGSAIRILLSGVFGIAAYSATLYLTGQPEIRESMSIIRKRFSATDITNGS
jgi:putative peptidoglycan lipid II flippase